MQRELQRPAVEAKPDWHGRNGVKAIKTQEKMLQLFLREVLCDLRPSAFRFGKTKRQKTARQQTEEKKRRLHWLFQNLERDDPRTAWIRTLQPHEEATDSFAVQNWEQNVPRTDWDFKSQPHEEAASSSSDSQSSAPPRRERSEPRTFRRGPPIANQRIFYDLTTHQPMSLETAVRRVASRTAASPWVRGMATLRTDLSAAIWRDMPRR